MIDDVFASSALGPREKAAIRLVDVMLDDPHALNDETRAELLGQFDTGQVIELALAIALFHGFSKIAVALGPPPEMPTTVVPTPDVMRI